MNKVRGRKGKEYTENQLREAYNMYADATIPYSKILEATGIPQFVLERFIAQNGLEILRRKITRSRIYANGDQVNELILAGKSVKAVSELLHMNVNAVKYNMSEEAWSIYLSIKRQGPAPKAENTSLRKLTTTDLDLSQDEKLKTALKMYTDTQLSFKEIQDATGVLSKSLKRYISTLESIKDISKG